MRKARESIHLEIRTSNVEFKEPGTQKVELRAAHGADLVREGQIVNPGTPWVIVVIPDGALNLHREVTGVDGPAK